MLRVMKFETEYRADREPKDKVLLAPMDDWERTQTWQYIHQIIPPANADNTTKNGESYQAMAARWALIEPQYKAWKEGHELPETGTPLAAWAALTQAQAEALKGQGLRTVEEVAESGEAIMSRLRFPDARKLPELAKQFLSNESGVSKDRKLVEMEEKLAAMEELLEEAMREKPAPKPRAKKEPADA